MSCALSEKLRDGPAQGFSEFVATFGLVATILGAVRFRPDFTPVAVGLIVDTSAVEVTSAGDFAVLDRDATDGSATVRVPADTLALPYLRQSNGVLCGISSLADLATLAANGFAPRDAPHAIAGGEHDVGLAHREAIDQVVLLDVYHQARVAARGRCSHARRRPATRAVGDVRIAVTQPRGR